MNNSADSEMKQRVKEILITKVLMNYHKSSNLGFI